MHVRVSSFGLRVWAALLNGCERHGRLSHCRQVFRSGCVVATKSAKADMLFLSNLQVRTPAPLRTRQAETELYAPFVSIPFSQYGPIIRLRGSFRVAT